VTTLFVSDIHLAPDRPDLSAAFLSFLSGPAREASGVYILGDLFDAWLGDDDLAHPAWRPIIQGLRHLSDGGATLHVQHGNRDFLLGDAFARACGARLMPEAELTTIEGETTLLIHGDQLCTDDHAYLAWRKQARDPRWQAQFLALPLDQRRLLAAELRAASSAQKAEKPAEIMDVNAHTVAAALRAAGQVRLIHGHTHRPARHEHWIDGVRCERWVLPAWEPPGGYLESTPGGLRPRPWPSPTDSR
jgi:UDP-2,3-diacylglucosamine hydrolase